MPSKVQAVLIVAAALVSAVMIAPPADGANPCSGDTSADNMVWTDHYWVGYDYTDGYPSCDKWGEYTVAIQRINWGEGYRNSSVDGKYGSKTNQDVRAMQSRFGLYQDGLVGPQTWGAYDNFPVLRACYAGPDCYWYLPNYNSSVNTFRKLGVAQVQSQRLGYAGWVTLSTSGPA